MQDLPSFRKNYNSLFKILSGFCIALLLLCCTWQLKAQEENNSAGSKPPADSIVYKHSPQKATLYSLVLPGLGQAYNKKYWKIPIVYAGFGVLGYFAITNGNEYRKYRQAFDYVTQGDQSIPINNDYVDKYEPEQLAQGRDYYRRNLEFTYILTGFWYILNVVDAVVDAHLYYYSIDDDLGIRLEPVMDYANMQPNFHPGISLRFRF
ncbi:MAG: DUF5683 domain-containing protein [Bacteroidota bacterium]|nr:DUF5683 domain-containing protein [Bacteroidota bacterium]